MEYNIQRQSLNATHSPITRDGFEQYKEEIRQAKMRVLTHIRDDERFSQVRNQR